MSTAADNLGADGKIWNDQNADNVNIVTSEFLHSRTDARGQGGSCPTKRFQWPMYNEYCHVFWEYSISQKNLKQFYTNLNDKRRYKLSFVKCLKKKVWWEVSRRIQINGGNQNKNESVLQKWELLAAWFHSWTGSHKQNKHRQITCVIKRFDQIANYVKVIKGGKQFACSI